jgi:hypothetical protein
MGKENNFGSKINSNGFDKNPQNTNKNGRPLRIYSILKKLNYGKDDIIAIFKEIPFYNKEELKNLVKKKDTPLIILAVAKSLEKSINQGDFKAIKEIIEHLIGKPMQEIKQEINQNINLEGKTDDDLDNLIKKLSE